MQTTGLQLPEHYEDLKTAIQDATLQIEERVIVFEFATGAGKTRPSLLHCKGKSLIVCKQVDHQDTWRKEAVKWGVSLKDLTIICYNSLSKEKGKHYDVVVLDEVHGLTDARYKMLKSISFDKLVCVSATIKPDVFSRIYKISGGKPRVVRIPFAKAIAWGLIPCPDIRMCHVPLDDNSVNQVYKRRLKKATELRTVNFNQFEKLKHNLLNFDVMCTEKQLYSILQQDFEAAKKQYVKAKTALQSKPWDKQLSEQVQFFELKMLRTGGFRKQYLGKLRTKYAQQFIDVFSSERLVVFCNDIEQCEALAQGHPTLHSKSEDKDLIDRFNAGEIDKLFVVKKIDEGINLQKQFTALIVSLSGSLIQSLQRLGRTLRESGSSLYIFHTPGTVDDKYLNTLREEFPQEMFRNVSIHQINNKTYEVES